MSCSAYITDLASFIWNDLGQPSSLSVSAIQTKLTSAGFLGQFNVQAATCYQITTGDISPALGNYEQGIYVMMYERDFYTRKLNQLLDGDATPWTRLTDGDSTIVRTSIADLARIYRDMQSQLNAQLQMALAAYRRGQSMPSSVDYFTLTNGNWYYDPYGGPIGGYMVGPGPYPG